MGPGGTEYLLNNNVRRSMLGKGNNSKIVVDPTKIQFMPLFSIGIMKGAIFNEDHLSLIHRSREIQSVGADRMVYKITSLAGSECHCVDCKV
jgi:hypothetical protein